MNYTITPGGIVFSGIGLDYQHEEAQTDRISDAQQEPPPIPLDEAVEMVKHVAEKIEAMG